MSIRSKEPNKNYDRGWDRNFKNKGQPEPACSCGANSWKVIYEPNGERWIECKRCKSKLKHVADGYYVTDPTAIEFIPLAVTAVEEHAHRTLATRRDVIMGRDNHSMGAKIAEPHCRLCEPLVVVDQNQQYRSAAPRANAEHMLVWHLLEHQLIDPLLEGGRIESLRDTLASLIFLEVESFKGCAMRPAELYQIGQVAKAVAAQFLDLDPRRIDVEVVAAADPKMSAGMRLWHEDADFTAYNHAVINFREPPALKRLFSVQQVQVEETLPEG